jgi:hypothetical protein
MINSIFLMPSDFIKSIEMIDKKNLLEEGKDCYKKSETIKYFELSSYCSKSTSFLFKKVNLKKDINDKRNFIKR